MHKYGNFQVKHLYIYLFVFSGDCLFTSVKVKSLQLALTIIDGAPIKPGETITLKNCQRGNLTNLEANDLGVIILSKVAKKSKTCDLVKNIPQIKNNRRKRVKFSVMKSGTFVPTPSGPTNYRLRAHLGLSRYKITFRFVIAKNI